MLLPKGHISYADLSALISIKTCDAYERELHKLSKKLPYMLSKIIVLFLSLSFSTLAYAENIKRYWNIEIPVMKGATNISEEKNPRFSRINKTYDLILTDPIEVSQFYDKFFESNGWVNWAKGVSEVLNAGNDSNLFIRGWSSYYFNVNSDGTPEAIFQLMWNSKKVPEFANLRLELNDYSKGKFRAKIKISIVPKINFEDYTCKIKELFNEPQNFFILSRAVKGDPTKFENIDLEHLNKIKNTDPLIEKYCNIVTDIMKEYKQFYDNYYK